MHAWFKKPGDGACKELGQPRRAYLGNGLTSFMAELAGVEALVFGLLLFLGSPAHCGKASEWYEILVESTPAIL